MFVCQEFSSYSCFTLPSLSWDWDVSMFVFGAGPGLRCVGSPLPLWGPHNGDARPMTRGQRKQMEDSYRGVGGLRLKNKPSDSGHGGIANKVLWCSLVIQHG